MKSIFLNVGIFLILVLSSSSMANSEEIFRENSHFKRVSDKAIPLKSASDKIEVVEFFLYSCPHCYELEPKLKAWIEKNKDKITFKRTPAVLSPSWVALAKAYYVAEKLNVLDKTHEALFKSIHQDKVVYLNEYKLTEFFVKHGVNAADFIREFNAADIVEKVGAARALSVEYEFRGVPVVVMNKEFKTAPFYTKDQDQMIRVLDSLLGAINNRETDKRGTNND